MTFNNTWVARHATDPIIKRKARFVMRQINKISKNIEPPVNVLDVGCGSGVLVECLNHSSRYVAEGIDNSLAAIEFCERARNGLFHYGELGNHDLGKYDIVVATHLLEHIETPAKFLYHVRESLQPWGKFVVVVPNLSAYDATSIWRKASVWLIKDKDHVAFYSAESLSQVLMSAGFQIESVYSHTYPALMMRGYLSGIYRKQTHTEQCNERVVAESTANVIDRLTLATEWVFAIPARISEKGCRGGDLIVVARMCE